MKLKFPYVVKKLQSHTTHYSEILEKIALISGKIFAILHIQGGAKRTHGFETTIIGFILITEKMYSHQYNV